MERKILHQKIQMPAYWWLCTRQIVLGAQLAAIYVDVCAQYGTKFEKMCNLGEPHSNAKINVFCNFFDKGAAPKMKKFRKTC